MLFLNLTTGFALKNTKQPNSESVRTECLIENTGFRRWPAENMNPIRLLFFPGFSSLAFFALMFRCRNIGDNQKNCKNGVFVQASPIKLKPRCILYILRTAGIDRGLYF